MNQTTVPVNGPLTVIIESVSGDLQVAGWDRAEVTAKTDGDDAELRVEGDIVYARAQGDLALYLPREASLQTASVGGDADVRAVAGEIRMATIGGDLQMRAVGPVVLQNVGGDLSVRGCAGGLSAESIGSDALVRDLQGDLKIANVGSDLCLRNLNGSIHAMAGADAILYLQPSPIAKIYIQAGSDILLHLPPQTDAELSLQGGSMESVRIDFAGAADPGSVGPVRTVKIGSGAAKISLMAGGDLIVTGLSDAEEQPQVEFGGDGPGEMPPPPGGFGSNPPPGGFPGDGFMGGMPDFSNFGEQFTMHFEQTFGGPGRRSQERAERRVEAAMRRAEEKMRASERRANFVGMAVGRGSVGRPPVPPIPPVPPAPLNEPVSDVERLAVLRMLQEKKISLEDAEKLLAALEGK